MKSIRETIKIQQQYQQGSTFRKKQTVVSATDITSEQWFWDMAVIS